MLSRKRPERAPLRVAAKRGRIVKLDGLGVTLSRIITVLFASLLPVLTARADVPVLSGESTANRGGVEIKPAPAPAGPFEQSDIRRGAAPAGGATTRAAAGAASPTRWDLGKVPAALAAVIVLILVLRFVGKGMLPGAAAGKGSRAVQIVARTAVGPKHQVMLLQVGRRLVLVGAGGGGEMSPLCQITDSDEVAEVLAQAKGGAAPARGFGSAMNRASRNYDALPDQTEPERDEPPEVADEPADLAGLMARVRRMSDKFQQS